MWFPAWDVCTAHLSVLVICVRSVWAKQHSLKSSRLKNREGFALFLLPSSTCFVLYVMYFIWRWIYYTSNSKCRERIKKINKSATIKFTEQGEDIPLKSWSTQVQCQKKTMSEESVRNWDPWTEQRQHLHSHNLTKPVDTYVCPGQGYCGTTFLLLPSSPAPRLPAETIWQILPKFRISLETNKAILSGD